MLETVSLRSPNDHRLRPYTWRVALSLIPHSRSLICPTRYNTHLSRKLLRLWIFITYLKQPIHYFCNLSGNRDQLRWCVAHKHIWSGFEKCGKFLILQTDFKVHIVQHDWCSLLLFLCHVYSLCQNRQCFFFILRQERCFRTRSSPLQWKFRCHRQFWRSISKGIHYSQTNRCDGEI